MVAIQKNRSQFFKEGLMWGAGTVAAGAGFLAASKVSSLLLATTCIALSGRVIQQGIGSVSPKVGNKLEARIFHPVFQNIFRGYTFKEKSSEEFRDGALETGFYALASAVAYAVAPIFIKTIGIVACAVLLGKTIQQGIGVISPKTGNWLQTEYFDSTENSIRRLVRT